MSSFFAMDVMGEKFLVRSIDYRDNKEPDQLDAPQHSKPATKVQTYDPESE